MENAKKIINNLLTSDLERIARGESREEAGIYEMIDSVIAELDKIGIRYKHDDFCDEEAIRDVLTALTQKKETLTKIIERENAKIGNGEGIDNGADLYDYILTTGEVEATEEECEEVFEEYLKNF